MSFNYGFWLMTCADSDLKDSPNSALSFCISLMWLATHCITSQASINSNKKVSCNREVARGKVYVLHSICQKIPFVNWFILYKQESLPYLNYRQLIEGNLELKLTYHNSIWSKRQHDFCWDTFICNSRNRNMFTALYIPLSRTSVHLFLLVTESDVYDFYMILFLTTNMAVLFRVL